MMEVCCVINALGIEARGDCTRSVSLPGSDLFAFEFCDQAGAPVVGFGENGLFSASVASRALKRVLVYSRLSGKRNFAHLNALARHMARLTGYIIG
jgi:hypothetical protein